MNLEQPKYSKGQLVVTNDPRVGYITKAEYLEVTIHPEYETGLEEPRQKMMWVYTIDFHKGQSKYWEDAIEGALTLQ